MPGRQTLPIAAIAVGAPVVGGALFIADQLFGSALDRATTIHYRARGPWTSPQVTLESSELSHLQRYRLRRFHSSYAGWLGP